MKSFKQYISDVGNVALHPFGYHMHPEKPERPDDIARVKARQDAETAREAKRAEEKAKRAEEKKARLRSQAKAARVRAKARKEKSKFDQNFTGPRKPEVARVTKNAYNHNTQASRSHHSSHSDYRGSGSSSYGGFSGGGFSGGGFSGGGFSGGGGSSGGGGASGSW